MRITLAIICTLLLSKLTTVAQGGMLYGVVYGQLSEEKIKLYRVVVIDYSNSQSTTTDEQGSYALKTSPGDSIVFSTNGYFVYTYIVPAFSGKLEKNISLNQKKNIIKGVKVIGLTKYQQDSLERADLVTDVLDYEQVVDINSPITSLYQQFSKKYKGLRKFQKQYITMEQQNFVDSKYTYELVNKVTKLSGDSAALFMNAYPMEYNFARTSSALEIKLWIKYNYNQYIKLPYAFKEQTPAVKQEEKK